MVIKCSEHTHTLTLQKIGIYMSYQVLTITVLLVSFLFLHVSSVGRALRRDKKKISVNNFYVSIYKIPLPSTTSLCVTTFGYLSVFFCLHLVGENDGINYKYNSEVLHFIIYIMFR